VLGAASGVLDRLGLGIQTPTASKSQYTTREVEGVSVVDLRGKIAFGAVSYTHLDVYKRQVEHRAGNELLEQVEGLLIAELLEERPEFRLVVEFFHADAARLGAGL